jgi:hypothetical protein
MIKFLIGFGITILYFVIYEISKRTDTFTNLITIIIICSGCYYLGDMVMYRYLGNLL